MAESSGFNAYNSRNMTETRERLSRLLNRERTLRNHIEEKKASNALKSGNAFKVAIVNTCDDNDENAVKNEVQPINLSSTTPHPSSYCDSLSTTDKRIRIRGAHSMSPLKSRSNSSSSSSSSSVLNRQTPRAGVSRFHADAFSEEEMFLQGLNACKFNDINVLIQSEVINRIKEAKSMKEISDIIDHSCTVLSRLSISCVQLWLTNADGNLYYTSASGSIVTIDADASSSLLSGNDYLNMHADCDGYDYVSIENAIRRSMGKGNEACLQGNIKTRKLIHVIKQMDDRNKCMGVLIALESQSLYTSLTLSRKISHDNAQQIRQMFAINMIQQIGYSAANRMRSFQQLDLRLISADALYDCSLQLHTAVTISDVMNNVIQSCQKIYNKPNQVCWAIVSNRLTEYYENTIYSIDDSGSINCEVSRKNTIPGELLQSTSTKPVLLTSISVTEMQRFGIFPTNLSGLVSNDDGGCTTIIAIPLKMMSWDASGVNATCTIVIAFPTKHDACVNDPMSEYSFLYYEKVSILAERQLCLLHRDRKNGAILRLRQIPSIVKASYSDIDCDRDGGIQLLPAFISSFGKSLMADQFSARSSILLVGNAVVAASLDKYPCSRISDPCTQVFRQIEEFQGINNKCHYEVRKILEITEDMMTLWWVKKLLVDKAVVIVNHLNKIAGGSVDDTQIDKHLRHFIATLDTYATSVALAPIQSKDGLNILVLIDRISDDDRCALTLETIANRTTNSKLVSFTTDYDVALYNESMVFSLLSQSIDEALKLHAAYASFDVNRRCKEEMLVLGDRIRRQKLLNRCFSNWKTVNLASSMVREDTTDSLLLKSVVQLLHDSTNNSHRSNSDKDSRDSLQSYLSNVELHALNLFPSDAVVVSRGEYAPVLQQENINVVYIGNNNCNATKCSKQVHNSRTTLVAMIHYHHTPSASSANIGNPHDKVIGTITITRSSLSGVGRFTAMEMDALKRFSEVASTVFTSLHIGMKPTLDSGNVTGLLLPMLKQVIPVLMDLAAKGYSDYKQKIPIVVSWLKKICNSDVALLTLSGSNRDRECCVSSEDTDIHNLHVAAADDDDISQSYKALLVDASRYHSAADADATSTSSVDGAHTNSSICYQLLSDVDASCSDVVGEIKVLGPHDVAFTRDQCCVVEIISYIIAYIYSMSKQYKQVEDTAIRSTNLAKQLELMLMTDRRQLAIEKESCVLYHTKLTNLLALLLCSSKCLKAPSIESLGKIIYEYLPQVLHVKSAVLVIDMGGSGQYSIVYNAIRDGVDDNSEFVDQTQLHCITQFNLSPSAAQSKILLCHQHTTIPYGAIILTRSSVVSDTSGAYDHTEDWKGLEDMVCTTMNSTFDNIVSQLKLTISLQNSKRECAAVSSRLSQASIDIQKQSDSYSKLLETYKKIETNAISEVEDVVSLVGNYSFDHRTHSDKVIDWLQEVCKARGVHCAFISQQEGGVLSMSSNSSNSTNRYIRGIIAAAGEALQTRTPIELDTAYSGTGALCGSSILQHSVDTSIAVYIVPNRFVASIGHSYDHACFVYIKEVKRQQTHHKKSSPFTSSEKQVYACIASLCARSLFRGHSDTYTNADCIDLEQKLNEQTIACRNYSNIIAKCEQLWCKPFISKSDSVRLVEASIIPLLHRRENDPYQVRSMLIPMSKLLASDFDAYTDTTSARKDSYYQHLCGMGLAADVEYVYHVISTGKVYKHGSILWCPVLGDIVNGVESVVAIIRIERVVANSTSTSYHSHDMLDHNLNSILITPEEVSIVTTYCKLVYPLFDKLRYLSDAFDGVEQASMAIATLQSMQVQLEARLVAEVSHKLQVEEAMKAGLALLSVTSSMRYARMQVVDAARRAIISTTSSTDCYIIIPNDSNLFDSYPLDHNNNSSGSGTVLYTLDSEDNVSPIRVNLEELDLESWSLQLSKPLFSHTKNENGTTWQSWGVRRYQYKHMYHNDCEASMYSLCIPFMLKNGSKAMISVIRKGNQFTSIDKDCIVTISKILSYCLMIRHGDDASLERMELMQNEIDRLKTLEHRCAVLDMEMESIERSLCTTTCSAGGSYAELELLACCKYVFGTRVSAARSEDIDSFLSSNDSSKAHRSSSSSSSSSKSKKKQENIITSTVTSIHGKVQYWYHELSNATLMIGDGHSSALPPASNAEQHTVYFTITHKGYDHVSSYSTDMSLIHWKQQLKLRCAVLLKVLDVTLAIQSESQAKDMIAHEASIMAMERHASQVLLSASHRACLYLRTEHTFKCLAQSPQPAASSAYLSFDWLRSTLLHVSNQMSLATATDVSVGSLKIVQSRDITSGDIMSTYGINWFTNANESHVLSTSDSSSSSCSRYSFISKVLNPDHSFITDLTDPVHMAVSTGNVVILCHQETMSWEWDAFPVAVATASCGYDAGTIIIPIFLQSMDSVTIIAVKPAHKATHSSSHSYLVSAVSSWISIVNGVKEAVKARSHNYSTLQRLSQITSEYKSCKLTAFLRWKRVVLEQDSRSYESLQHHSNYQEQRLANWAELVRGINGASSSAPSSPVGLWRYSCRIITSMIASYVTLNSCALYLVNDEDQVVEMTAYQQSSPGYESTPPSDPAHSPYDFPTGAVDVRTVSLDDSVGYAVNELLLRSSYGDGVNQSQRILKLLRQHRGSTSADGDYDDRSSEEVWLLPIRTARSTVAVMRLSLNLAYGATMSPSPSPSYITPKHRGLQQKPCASNATAIELAQNASINFAELLAPLLAAASVSEGLKYSNDCSRMLMASIDLLQTVSAKYGNDGVSCTHTIAGEVSNQLSSHLGCQIRITLSSAAASSTDGSAVTDSHDDSSVLTETITDFVGGNVIGRVHADRTSCIRNHVRSDPIAKLLPSLCTVFALTLKEHESKVRTHQLQALCSVAQYYHVTADVISQCLVFLSDGNSHSSGNSNEEVTYQTAALKSSARMSTFLQSVCTKLMDDIVDLRTVCFALLPLSQQRHVQSNTSPLSWVAGEGKSLQLYSQLFDIIENLARAAIKTGQKSDVVIDGNDYEGGYRVVTFPMIMIRHSSSSSSKGDAIVGTMQIIVKKNRMDASTSSIDDVCDDVCNAVGSTVFQYNKMYALSMQALNRDVAMGWKSVALAQTAISRGCGVNTSIADILQGDTVQDSLKRSQLQLRVRDARIAGSSKAKKGTKAKDVYMDEVSIDDDTVVEIVYNSNSNSSDGSNCISPSIDNEMICEMVDSLASVVRNSHTICKVRQGDAVEGSRRLAHTMNKYEHLKSELRIALSELLSVKDCNTKLQQMMSSTINKIYDPLIYNVIALVYSASTSDAWEGLLKVTDKTLSNIEGDSMKYHLSFIIADNFNSISSNSEVSSCNTLTYDNYQGKSVKTVSAMHKKVIDRCLDAPGGCYEVAVKDCCHVDVEEAILLSCLELRSMVEHDSIKALYLSIPIAASNTVEGTKESNGNKSNSICVIRVIYHEASAKRFNEGNSARIMMRPILQLIARISRPILDAIAQRLSLSAATETKRYAIEEASKIVEQTNSLLSKTRKIYTIVRREATVLLDPPSAEYLQNLSSSRSHHTALLSHTTALQDTCMKILSMSRTLLKSEGQAITFPSPGGGYKVIATGNILSWEGVVGQGLRYIPAASQQCTSLFETVMSSHKSVTVVDAHSDERYNPYIDGNCSVRTPLLLVPIRGTSSSVIGILTIARSHVGPVFTVEDVVAAELISALGGLSLHWIEGVKLLKSEDTKDRK